MNRRSLLSTAVWSVPVVGFAVAAPAAAASQRPSGLRCVESNTPAVVTIQGDVFSVTFGASARNSTDVTIRQDGQKEIQFNFVPAGTPTNGVPHMVTYRPGETHTIPLGRAWKAGDWFQCSTIHKENCTEE